MVVGELGDQLSDAEEEKVAADVVEGSLVTVLFDEGEGWDEDGVVELDERVVFEEAVGDSVGLALVHGEETFVVEGIGGEVGVGAGEGGGEGEVGGVTAHEHGADGE